MAEPWERLPFAEQIAYLAQKVNVPTDSYRDISGAEHDAAFVVAGAKGAVLNDFRTAVDRAIATGQTLEQFRQEFDSIVERTGWTFRGGSAWRANVIWDTNLRTSYAAGRYEQMQQVTTNRPYWQWRHGGSAHPRPQHLALDGKVFRHDDPFWSSFGSPPSGYGCRCSLFTLSDRDLERRGLVAEPGPQLGDRLPIPDLPGQTTAMNPPAGWGHLHGSSGPQHRAQLLDAVTRRLDPAIAAQVRAEAAAFEESRRPPPGMQRDKQIYVDRHLRGTAQMQRELRRGGNAHVFVDEATLERVEQRLLEEGIFTGTIRKSDRYGLLFDEVIGYRVDTEGNEIPLYYGELKVKNGKYHANPRTKASR